MGAEFDFDLEPRHVLKLFQGLASQGIIGDEIWNFADGVRSVNDIADAVGAEFDFDLEPRHVLKLFQGLASQGFVSLPGASD